MTLNTNEIVYTADYMNISPANDAQIYGLSGDWIISGLQLTSITPTSAVLTAGKAIIQGRLFELKANTTYTLTAGAVQYLGLSIDLSQANSDNGDGTIINNQFTVGTSTGVFGDTRLGDIQAFVGIYQINPTDASSTKLIFNYSENGELTGYGDVGYPIYNTLETPRFVRQGKVVSVYGAVANSNTVLNDGKWLTIRILPESLRPIQYINKTVIINSKLSEMRIRNDGTLEWINRTGSNIPARTFISIAFTYVIK